MSDDTEVSLRAASFDGASATAAIKLAAADADAAKAAFNAESAVHDDLLKPKDNAGLIVRAPTITDAVGAGMAHHAILQELYGGLDKDIAVSSEEELVEYWHDKITHLRGRKIALACSSRRVVGIALLESSPEDDHGLGTPARVNELVCLHMLSDFYSQPVLQRMFDFVLPAAAPAQIWVWREDQRLRRFLRINGFILDGLSIAEDNGLEFSRLTR
ncbi:MAG: hypothetical protein Q4P66_01885 [Actinomycetaceae bacterium]|nr:hypothetical protein [Actinomycetaceae bacterium]